MLWLRCLAPLLMVSNIYTDSIKIIESILLVVEVIIVIEGKSVDTPLISRKTNLYCACWLIHVCVYIYSVIILFSLNVNGLLRWISSTVT